MNKNSNRTKIQASKSTQNGSKAYAHADTPRAFTRLISGSGKRPHSSLDNGDNNTLSKKKQKRKQATKSDPSGVNTQSAAGPAPRAVDIPKILPGERLGDYAARVDHALPIAGLARSGKVKVEGMKERQTRMEKRLHRMYADWRAEEARLKEKEEEAREKQEEEDEEQEAKYGSQVFEGFDGPGRKSKKRRRKVIGETGGVDDDDPWAELKVKREGRRGLHDVVQAPPVFKAVPKEKFKVRNGAKVNVVDVPNKAGSLKKREELGEARREVIERYRAMMKKGN